MSQSRIHPAALVSPDASLGRGVTVAAFACVEENVEIGDDCVIQSHVVVHAGVRMGCGNRLFPHAVIGGSPQDLGLDEGVGSFVEIGDHNVFREGVTVHRSAGESGVTRIGSGCYLMTHSHVAHDCVLGDRNIFASGATLGGHVRVGDGVFWGGGAMVHQFCRIGSLSMIRGV